MLWTRAGRRAIASLRRPHGSVPVDTLMWAFAYTRDHVETYFDMLARLGIANAELKSSEDVPLSFAGRGPAMIHGVGTLYRCPSESEPGIATWKRPGFFEHRLDLVGRCRALQAAGASQPTQPADQVSFDGSDRLGPVVHPALDAGRLINLHPHRLSDAIT